MQIKNQSGHHDGEKTHFHPDFNDETIDLRELLRKLNRRRNAMFGVFLLVMVITTLYVYQATPRYTAQALMLLDLRQSQVVDFEAVLSGMPKDVSAIRSEIDVIRSRTLMERVIDKLRLEYRPEFNPALAADAGPGFVQQAKTWLKSFWPAGDEEPVELSEEEIQQQLRSRIVNQLRAGLGVENPRQSYSIVLDYTALSPRSAAEIANAVAELYLTDQMEAKFEATRRANEWLSERLESLQQEVNTAEMAVQEMRKQGGLIQARGSTVLEQQIAELNAQLVIARVALSQAEARLRSAREATARADAAALGDVLASPIVQRLRGEEGALQRKQAELSKRYGQRHPEMIKINAELADIRSKVEEETARVVESLANEVQIASAKERSLFASLNELRAQTSSALQAEVELRELERRAQSVRVIYENFLTRFKETGEQEALYRPDARVVSWAEPPASASFPRKKRTLGLGAVVALMLSVMAAFLLETLDRGFRTGNQLEQLAGISVLGMVPVLAGKLGAPENYITRKPLSSFAESLRGIRTAIQLSNVDNPPKSVMVTSALPREGKSTFCLSLGRMAAASGAKVILIDADLRRPSQSARVPEAESKYKLEDVLSNVYDIKEAIAVDKETGLHLLLAHGRTPAAAELLGSKRMAKLISFLSQTYDLVLIDTPPVMGVSDAWALAKNVDSVIFVVQWAATPRETVQTALQQMRNLDLPVSGLVLNQVNMRYQAKYGYGSYGYYYGKYRKYYKE